LIRNPLYLSAALGALALVSGCAEDAITPPPANTENTIGIDEDVVLSASGVLPPSADNGTQFTFDLSGVALVTSGKANDLQVLYTTQNTCDTDVNIYNVGSQQWDPVGIAPTGPVFCLFVVTNWERIISERGYALNNYVDGSNELLIESGPTPSVRAVELNSRYRAIPFLPEGISASGIEVIGNVLWLPGDQEFNRYTTGGVAQSAVSAGSNAWTGVAFDGQNLWTISGGNIYSYSPQGDFQCSFLVLGTEPTALTYADGRLWLARDGKLERVNPVTSCLNNSADIESSIPSTVPDVTGLASDDENFYVASLTTLVVVNMAGAVVDTYPFPVESVNGVAYVNGGLWLVHHGPKGARVTAQFASRFLLP
jgi:hypothetical protein